MTLSVDLVEGLTARIVDDLKKNGVDHKWVEHCVRPHVQDVLKTVQEMIYQEPAASLLRIAHDLSPTTARTAREP